MIKLLYDSMWLISLFLGATILFGQEPNSQFCFSKFLKFFQVERARRAPGTQKKFQKFWKTKLWIGFCPNKIVAPKKNWLATYLSYNIHVLEVWVEKKTGLQFQTFDKSGMLHAGILALGGAFGHAHGHFGTRGRVWACTQAIWRLDAHLDIRIFSD